MSMNKTWVLCATNNTDLKKKKRLHILLCVAQHIIDNCGLRINELSPAPQDSSTGPEKFPLKDFSGMTFQWISPSACKELPPLCPSRLFSYLDNCE